MYSIPSTVFCDHCDKFVSRATADRHKKKTHLPPLAPDTPILQDLGRKKRCLPSSDEDEEELLSPDLKSQKFEDEDDIASESDDSLGSNQDDEGYDPGNTQYWDDATEEDVQRDTEDTGPATAPAPTDPLMYKEAQYLVNWLVTSVLTFQNRFTLTFAVISHLLNLISQLLSYLARFCKIVALAEKIFPNSLHNMYKYIGFDRDNFTKYVVCQNCQAIYKYDEVVYHHNGRSFARTCNNDVYGCRVANERTRRKGKHHCGGVLVREVRLSNGKSVFYPLKVYCYAGIINCLENFLKRPFFVQNCQEWRNRVIREDVYADIYDGHIWKKFASDKFFDSRFSFGAMLNVDWFQPFKRRRDISVGVIYLTIMNLPRTLRFKRENTFLIGIIPAFSKEPGSINSFLKPLVDELRVLWNGIELHVHGETQPQKVKLALLCTAADIPAARKLLGFMGHGAKQGCSHCKKDFYKGGDRYCGGFDVHNWQARTKEEHILYAKRAENAKFLTGKKDIEKTYGYKYSPLLELPYFEPSKFCAIDPMHNLFLGTSKRIFEFWVENEILGKKELEQITERIANLNVPSDIGRIPSNISSNYGTFTAKEWKNWVLVYSVIVLEGLIPPEHLKLWQTFVLACRHLCQPCIHQNNLDIAHGLIIKFCKGSEKLYGSEFVTPNMHLHCHLKESVRDFGSVYGFWLFGFERFNGILADFPNNKRSVEIQFMRRFLQMGYVDGLKYQDLGEFQDHFNNLCSEESEIAQKCDVDLLMASDDLVSTIPVNVWSDFSLCDTRSEGYELGALNAEDKERLRQMYAIIYRKDITLDCIATCFRKFASVRYNNELRGSSCYCRTDSAQVQFAKWTDDDCNISENGLLRPGRIRYYLQHDLNFEDDSVVSHMLAAVDWYKHTDRDYGYLPPASVWSTKFLNDGPATYIPVQRIAGRCAWKSEKKGNTRVLVSCSILQHTYI